MTTFQGNANANTADAVNGILIGFSGGGVAQLIDTDDDVFIGREGNDIIIVSDNALDGHTLSGGAGRDTLRGSIGADRISYDLGDIVAGEIADGRDGDDRLEVLAQVNDTTFDFRTVQLLSIERFETVGDDVETRKMTIIFNASQFGNGGLASDFRLDPDGLAQTIQIVMNGQTFFDASPFRFTRLGDEDHIRIVGGAASETLIGDGNSELFGNGGNDTLRGDQFDNDLLSGGTGNDTADFSGTFGGLRIDLNSTNAQDTISAGIDRLLEIENLLGGRASDHFTGSAFANVLTGNELDDWLFGNGGNDTLDGGTGNDRMTGGQGNDTYIVDSAADITTEAAIINGGIDTVRSSVSRTLDANIETLVLVGTGVINGTGNNLINTLTGNAQSNILDGQAGIDFMTGGDGNDVFILDNTNDSVTELNGAASGSRDRIETEVFTVDLAKFANVEDVVLKGTLTLSVIGNAAANSIFGNAGANNLFGLNGADVLSGAQGNDAIQGGNGRDLLFGGTGNDTYDFNATAESGPGATARDVINDFVQGQDKIDLSTIDGNGAAGGDAFGFFGQQALSGIAGQLRFFQVNDANNANDRTIIQGDTNGDAVADIEIEVVGIINFAATDFFV